MAMVTVVLGALILLLGGGAPFRRVAADVFCDNFKLATAILPRNTSSSPVHFATMALGQAPDVVYALPRCRGDVLDDSACGDCIASISNRMLNATPPEGQECWKEYYWYGDVCGVFYSSQQNIIAPYNSTVGSDDDTTTPFERWNIKNVTGDVDLIVGLTRQLLDKTVQRAASATPRRFATGVMDSGTVYPSVHSEAQCTPDMSARDCLACLGRLLGMVNSTMALRMGA